MPRESQKKLGTLPRSAQHLRHEHTIVGQKHLTPSALPNDSVSTRRPDPMDYVRYALPDLESDGSWQIISERMPADGKSVVLRMLINMHSGECYSLSLHEFPLDAEVRDTLNECLAREKMKRLYFDGDSSLHRGALVSWGVARGVSVIIHFASREPDKVINAMLSVNEAMCDLAGCNLDDFQRGIATWRSNYNAALSPAQ